MSFWFPAVQVAAKLERLRSAEQRLLDLAHCFGSESRNRYQIDVLDTLIPRSTVPLTDFPSKGDDSLSIHSIRVVSTQQGASSLSRGPLVLLHGYMNGAAYFYRNLVGLSHAFPAVFSVDLLGWGLSSRPPFRLRQSDQGHDDIRQAEDFFVESLEAWRKAQNITTFSLAGHSMGGYISVAYAERYPEHVEHLILISPVGVSANNRDATERIRRARLQSFPFRVLTNVWYSMYDYKYSVGNILRILPEERTQKIASGYIEKRLPAITDPVERKALSDYLYLNNTLPGSGEYCIHAFLDATLHARKPLETRIPRLPVSSVSFLYGERDWMDVNGGLRVKARCSEKTQPDVSVYRVNDAGHLLMLDNYRGVNAGLIRAVGGDVAVHDSIPEYLMPSAEHFAEIATQSDSMDDVSVDGKANPDENITIA